MAVLGYTAIDVLDVPDVRDVLDVPDVRDVPALHSRRARAD